MAQIKLIFKPDLSEVKTAIQSIKQDISGSLGNIKLGFDSGGAQAAQSFAANLQKVASAADEVSNTIRKTETYVDGALTQETELLKKATGEYERYVTEHTKGGKILTETVIHNVEEQRKAQEKTQKEAEQRRQREQVEAEKHRQAQIKRDEQWARDELRYEQETAKQIEVIHQQQRNTWKDFVKEQAAYKAQQEELVAQRAAEANRQMILDEEEAQRKRTAAWKAYFDEINGLSDQKTKQGIEDNRRAVLDEEEAQRKRTAAWKAYFDEINAGIAKEEKANKKREKAADSVDALRKGYANLLLQIENLKAQYPEGTFDEIEREAREAQRELQNLDSTSKTFVGDVDRLSSGLKKEKAQLAEVREETKKLDKVTESFWMNIQKFARWYIGGNIVTKVIGSLREALATMKEVDTELANIQKVTDRTDQQMQRTAEAAYKVASAYGVAAQDYLESVAEFAKAGFGDQSEQLAEIATKTQLVGDVTSTIANKFLIASNAAWKMNGDISTLNKTLDAANIIENNYATSIEKLAAGMPVVSSIAAQAGMTFEQTIAALGTITAVTQETGTKAATALRALILNILGAVGEYEDGIEITEESVKSLDGILQVYAKDALAAAKAAGTVINPMEAIAALAKASEEGLVNQAELFEVLSSLGGKLRTNQLTALVQNFDMMQEMLDKTTQSAGSADKEIGVMLDTWEAKTNILKNTWTEFIANTINSNFIKRILDISTAVVDFADNAGLAAAAAAGLFTIFKGKEVIGTLKDVRDTFKNLVKDVRDTFKNLGDVLKGTTSNMTAVTTSIGLMITAVSAFIMIYRQVEQARRESLEKAATEAASIQNLTDKYEDLTKKLGSENLSRDELITLLKKSTEKYNEEWESINDVNELREIAIGLINEETKAKAKQYILDNQAAYRMSRNILSGDMKVTMDYGGIHQQFSYEEAIAFYEKYIENAMKEESMTTAQARALGVLTDEYKRLKKEYEEATTTVEAYETALSILDGTYQNGRGVAGHTRDLGDAQDDVSQHTKSLAEKLQEASETATKYDAAIGGVVDAMADFGAGSIEVYNAMKSLEETIPGSTDKLYDFDTATVLAGDDIFTSKEAMLDFIDSSKQLEFTQAISELEALAAGYWDVAGAALAAMANQQAAAQMAGVLAFTTGSNPQTASAKAQLADLQRQKEEWDAYIETLRGRGDYGKGSSSGSRDYTPKSSAPERTTDAELERLKAIVSWEKAELNYLQASGKSLEDINKKRKSIQDALHEQAEYMRSALALMDDTNSTEAERKSYEADILSLSTEWWSLQKDILEAEKKELETRRALFDLLKKSIDEYYDRAVTDKERELTLEEKLLAVRQAEDALEKAKEQRTVRYWNASAGKWEWTYDRKTVQAAEESLKNAQKELVDFQREQAWKEFRESWEYIAQQLREGSVTFGEAYEYMAGELKRLQGRYNVNFAMVLEDSIGKFQGLNATVRDLTEEMAEELRSGIGLLHEELENYNAAVEELYNAFRSAGEAVRSGELTMEEAFGYLRDKAAEISERYGQDMSRALEEAVGLIAGVGGSIEELWTQTVLNLISENNARAVGAGAAERDLLDQKNGHLAGLVGGAYDPNSGGVSFGAGGGQTAAGGRTGTGGSAGGTYDGSGGAGSKVALSTASTAQELSALREMEEAYRTGDTATRWAIENRLRANGAFISTTVGGKPSGILYSVSGHSNGSAVVVLGGENVSGVDPGTLLIDGTGNYWRVAENGKDVTADGGSYASWYEQAREAGRLDYSRSNAMTPELFSEYLRAAVANGKLDAAAMTAYASGKLGMEDIMASPAWKALYAFDEGGILRGIGGIKATAQDEMVLNPKLTAKVLDLANSRLSATAQDRLEGLLDAATLPAAYTDNRIGSQHNGNIYQFGGVTLTEGTAKSTSVYDLAHMARGLGSYNQGN